jgi:hypothetical protein
MSSGGLSHFCRSLLPRCVPKGPSALWQEDPVRTISFSAILESVLAKLLTVLLTVLLLGGTSGRKNPRKHSVLGGADSTCHTANSSTSGKATLR